MPQLKLVRDTHRSSRPGLMKLFIISFTRDGGVRKVPDSSSSCTGFAYLERRKKYASSSASCTSRPQSGHLPSISWLSVQKLSQGVQYLPLYAPLYMSPLSYIFLKMRCTASTW